MKGLSAAVCVLLLVAARLFAEPNRLQGSPWQELVSAVPNTSAAFTVILISAQAVVHITVHTCIHIYTYSYCRSMQRVNQANI